MAVVRPSHGTYGRLRIATPMADDVANTLALLEAADAIFEHEPDAGRLDVSGLAKISDGELHRIAKTYFDAGSPRIAPVAAVLAVMRLEVGDVDAGVFWLRLLRAAANLEQVEPDSGAALH